MRRVVAVFLLAACNGPRPYVWNLPAGFATPVVPDDNPMTVEKVALGRQLFYDTRLSGNGTQSCGSCHAQEYAFALPAVTPKGSTGQSLPRNSMSLGNIAYTNYYTWANPLLRTLEEQMLVPMFGDAPVELGLDNASDEALARLRGDASTYTAFAAAFPGGNPVTIENVVRAIASFQRTMISGSSPYDRFSAGDATAMSASAQNGMALFFTERLDCYHCHAPPTFTTDYISTNALMAPRDFRNNGIYNIDGNGAYPPNNTGLYNFTGLDPDMGKFRVPTLRNIMLTAPYFHDGSAATIDDVIDSYMHGGRLLTTGPYAGDGSTNPHRDPLVKPFALADSERADLKAFFDALTDDTLINDPMLGPP